LNKAFNLSSRRNIFAEIENLKSSADGSTELINAAAQRLMSGVIFANLSTA